jgi:riboflavin kinase
MIKPILFGTLYRLALQGAIDNEIEISTSIIAKSAGYSQQTISRHLILLERMGLIERRLTVNGELIRITNKGKQELMEVYTALKEMFEKISEKNFTITGTVFTGLGEGAYYISRSRYAKQVESKLGFKPYPGTLNIKLISPPSRAFLNNYEHIFIRGFKSRERTFGPAKCYPVSINDSVEGAIIIPIRTHYDYTVVEVISPVNLRNAFNLRDGSLVTLKLKNPTNIVHE